MADTEAKGKKPEKSDKAPRPPKGEKPQAEQKAQKADKGGAAGKGEAAAKAPAPKKPEERVTPRLRTHFDEVVRKKLTEEFSYKNPMQVPVDREDRHQHGHRRGRQRPQEGRRRRPTISR